MTEVEKVQIDMKLEALLLGVSDVDRAKARKSDSYKT